MPALDLGAGRPRCKGLDTRLQPGRAATDHVRRQRPPRAATTSSTSTSVTRSCRRRSGCCAASLWSVDSPLNRVTAVVVDDLAESFVAAVTRMVLVGRGGLRLHEEVFLAGVRLHGRRAMAEEKAEAALDQALDGDRPGPRRRRGARPSCARCGTSRTHHCAPGWRSRCTRVPTRRHERVTEQLATPPGSRHPARPRDLRRVPHATCTSRSTSSNAPRKRPQLAAVRRRPAAPAPPRHRGDAPPPRRTRRRGSPRGRRRSPSGTPT